MYTDSMVLVEWSLWVGYFEDKTFLKVLCFGTGID